MRKDIIERKFDQIGADVRFSERATKSPDDDELHVFDLRNDKRRGQYYFMETSGDPDIEVLDVRSDLQHLLMMVRLPDEGTKQRYLCGYDEREYFIAAIPGGVSTVPQAMESLKPAFVGAAQDRKQVKTRDRTKRRTKAYKRQGEFFFVPRPELEGKLDETMIQKNRPLQRNVRGKAHMAEIAYTWGGTLVYTNHRRREGLTQREFEQLTPEERRKPWNREVRNAQVYAKGKITHSDHKTLNLGNVWHEVIPNTESDARWFGSSVMAFID
jgi:hypothetical protein